jgi:two-component system chemotaxis response regulator CheB
MGKDGAEGLLRMRESGASTVVQDERSCVVFGMPQEAIKLGAAQQVRPLTEIAQSVMDLVDRG